MNVSFKDRLKSLFSNDFFLAGLFLIAYLCTNRYVYAWDDQHLEIPLLKHLIDPSLYRGDYYVESLGKHFTTYMFPILARFITVAQIPQVYFVLFLVSRYAMFYLVFKLWRFICNDRLSAICATLMFFLMGRTEEFLYRTFSHQEFSFIFMFAGIYLFYRERFFLAALVFGLGANFHAIYNLIPMLYMLAFLVLFHPQRWRLSVGSSFIFMLGAMPFLFWQIPASLADKLTGSPVPSSEWIPLYVLSCYQNFFFADKNPTQVFHSQHLLLNMFSTYVYLAVLYAINWQQNLKFRSDNKFHAIAIISTLFIIANYVFSYIYPSRFVLDLNLIRVEQYLRFFLMGYTTLLIVGKLRDSADRLEVLLYGLLWISLLGATEMIHLAALALVVAFIQAHRLIRQVPTHKVEKILTAVVALAALLLAYLLIMDFKADDYIPALWLKLRFTLLAFVVFIGLLFYKDKSKIRMFLICLPLLAGFIQYCIYHYHYVQYSKTGNGFWQMQRNWGDMQNYVRQHTPKDALILTPYDTDEGGFRIGSERKVLVCYRDCGIIGFDYKATVEWHKRIQDVIEFKMLTQHPVDRAVLTAILKYKVDYIVFMNYYAPKGIDSVLKKIYENEVFSLFKVVMHV